MSSCHLIAFIIKCWNVESCNFIYQIMNHKISTEENCHCMVIFDRGLVVTHVTDKIDIDIDTLFKVENNILSHTAKNNVLLKTTETIASYILLSYFVSLSSMAKALTVRTFPSASSATAVALATCA